MWLSDDRWTCPECLRTVVPDVVGERALRRAIRAAQDEHAARHASQLEKTLRALATQPNASRAG